MINDSLIEDLKALVPTLVSEKRYAHIERVADMAVRLAETWTLNTEKAYISALAHDIAKALSPDQLEQFNVPLEERETKLFEQYPPVWHAFVGARILKHQFGFWDEEIATAIQWHTTGSDQMTLLDKIIYVADFIEVGRKHPYRTYLEEIAFKNIEEAVFGTVWCTTFSLLERGLSIHPATIACYNQQHLLIGNTRAKAISEGLREIQIKVI